MNTPTLQRLDDDGRTKIQLSIGEEADVSRLWALSFSMRIGSAVVSMGGIAGVGTSDAHRERGYASLVLQESTRYFRETGHDVALLFGIRDFYHRFGYAPVLAAPKFSVALSDVEAVQGAVLPHGYGVRTMETTDWPAVLDIYDSNTATRSGTLLRPREKWTGFRLGTEWGRTTEAFVISNATHKVVAYYVVDTDIDSCRVAEIGCISSDVFQPILAVIAAQARERKLPAFELYLPPDHAFARFCSGFCGCQFSIGYARNSGGMMRIINLHSLFQKLLDLLSQRLVASAWTAEGILQLQTDEGDISLQIERDQIALIPPTKPTWSAALPQHRLMQLIMGYRSAAEIAADEGVSIEAESLPLLDILFPIGFPWTPKSDWF